MLIIQQERLFRLVRHHQSLQVYDQMEILVDSLLYKQPGFVNLDRLLGVSNGQNHNRKGWYNCKITQIKCYVTNVVQYIY